MIKAEHAGDTCSAFSDVVTLLWVERRILQGVPWWSTYQVLGKMILNIFTPQLDDVEICCFEAITIPIVCS